MDIGVATFQAGGHSYRAGRLSTFDQLELATTLRQVFFNMALLEKAAEADGKPMDEASHAQAVCGFLGTVSAEERRTAVDTCLGAVSRRRDNTDLWDPVTQGGQLMFQDLDLPELMVIVYRVAHHNGLFRFFSVSPDTGGSLPLVARAS